MAANAHRPTGHASLMGATFGGYEVVGLIGRGAMGTVYLARDVALDRNVALKVLLGSLARNPSLVRSLHREARAAAPLRHPGIVRIYSAGVEDGTPYVAMEYVEGEPLDRFLRRKGWLSWQNAFHVGGRVADALECAHRRGIVHRDVKPANILLDCQGRVRLTDFGIANVQAEEGGLPEEDLFVGTPDYMSPEQCAGREVTPASDLFSLGVTLYQMIAGRLPFEGNSPMALIKSITTDEPPRLNKELPQVPDDVARLVAHLLQKRAENRPASALAVCQTIARLQAERGGRSAMPAALASFIKEQAEIRTVRVVASGYRPRKRGTRRAPGEKGQRRGIGWGRRAAIGAVVVVAIICAMAGLVRVSSPGAALQLDPAPVIEDFVFETAARGTLLTRLPSGSFRFREVSWVGDRSTVLVDVEGRQGKLTHGAFGLLAVDPESRTAHSVRPPVGPVSDPEFWRVAVPATGRHWIPPVPLDSPLRDAVLLQVCRGPTRDASLEVFTVAQKWNEAMPRSDILHQTTLYFWDPCPEFAGLGSTAGHAVMKPDGLTLCLVLYDPVRKTNYLAERDVRRKPYDRTGPPLTSLEGTILPQSVQYAPNGGHIAYIRETVDRADRELWVVASGGRELNGQLLEVAPLGESCAFSPDGGSIAVCVNRADGVPEVRLCATTGAPDVARLGPGLLGPGSWHPSGEFLVAVAPDPGEGSGDGARTRHQLWAIQTRAPYRRTRLTALAEGVRGECALSRDGRWVAAVVDKTHEPTLVFVDLRAAALKTVT